MKEAVMEELKKTFRAEFLNRISDTVIFHSLSRENIRAIAENLLSGVSRRAESLGLELHCTGEALALLTETGFDPAYGARALHRVIRSSVEDVLAEQLLSGALRSGDAALIEVGQGQILIRRVEPGRATEIA